MSNINKNPIPNRRDYYFRVGLYKVIDGFSQLFWAIFNRPGTFYETTYFMEYTRKDFQRRMAEKKAKEINKCQKEN